MVQVRTDKRESKVTRDEAADKSAYEKETFDLKKKKTLVLKKNTKNSNLSLSVANTRYVDVASCLYKYL